MRVTLVLALAAAACSSTPPATPAVADARPKAVTPASGPDRRASATTQRWAAKLDDPREVERAVTELEQLGDPDAIPALAKTWTEQGKPVRILQVIVSLARPLTPDEAKAKFVTDYESTGRPASWDRALPLLIRALLEVDDSDVRSIDSATKAADALGEARLPAAIDALIGVTRKPVTKKSIGVYVSAVRALGHFTTDKPKIAAALAAVVDRDPPPHPRTATDPMDRRTLEDSYALFLGTTGAAINALFDLRVTGVARSLVLALYRVPELFTQTRRALIGLGPTAEKELVQALRGDHADVNKLFKDKRLDVNCQPGGLGCQPVSAKDFYPAVVLGDFHDPATVPDLLAALKRPALPVYYEDDTPSPNTQHNAIFDALRKIGSPTAAASVRAAWQAPGGDVTTRILAIGAYPFVARDAADTDELGKIAADNAADDNLRQEAATAFARMARDPKDIAVLQQLAKKYTDASAAKGREAQPLRRDAEAADRALAAKREAAEKALTEARNTSTKSTAQIRAATDAATKAEAELRAANKAHKARVAPFKALDSAAKAYLGYARMFQTHIARIEVAIRCKTDLTCFAATLSLRPDDAAARVATYIPDIKTWSDDDKRGLVSASVERALLEIGNQGDKASSFTDQLLDAAASDDRLIRQSILLALPKIAKLPCVPCEAKLDDAIKAGQGKTSLGDLNLETQLLRTYFSWAGGKLPP